MPFRDLMKRPPVRSSTRSSGCSEAQCRTDWHEASTEYNPQHGDVIQPAALRAALSRLFLALAFTAAAVALAIFTTGGDRITIVALRVSATSVGRPLVAAAVFFFLYIALAPRHWRA